MKFEELNNRIPYVTGGMEHILSTCPYDGITLRMPNDDKPADFIVEITDDCTSWEPKQFDHQYIFDDFEDKTELDAESAKKLMRFYAKMFVEGTSPDDYYKYVSVVVPAWQGTLTVSTLTAALQCFMVAERRCQYDYSVTTRLAAGIVYGHWMAEDAKLVVRDGAAGVKLLERFHGKPPTLQELADGL